MTLEISKSFSFDAAHQLAANVPAGHHYAGLHGHSFDVTLSFGGAVNRETGWIRDFAEIDTLIGDLRQSLDHRYLNDVAGLERPTLEAIALWIWQRVAPRAPELRQVEVRRDSCREACRYMGPNR